MEILGYKTTDSSSIIEVDLDTFVRVTGKQPTYFDRSWRNKNRYKIYLSDICPEIFSVSKSPVYIKDLPEQEIEVKIEKIELPNEEIALVIRAKLVRVEKQVKEVGNF